MKALLITIAITLACSSICLKRFAIGRQVALPPEPIDLTEFVPLDAVHTELVVDYGDGNFRRCRGPNIVTFVTASNADRNPVRFTEFATYERLLFGHRLDYERDKTDRRFRLRITDPSLVSLSPESFVARFECAQSTNLLLFESVGGEIVSQPFIVVERLIEPRIEELTEIYYDMYRPAHNKLTREVFVRR